MKAISIFLASCLTALFLYSQNTSNTVTIKLNSNRYQQVLVDGKTYPVTNTNTSTTGTTVPDGIVTITDLQPGQHTLQVVRGNQNNTRRNNNNTRTFNIRARYDLVITVNNDGTFALNEIRNRNRGNAGRLTPMPDADFSALLQNVQAQRRATAKTTAVTNAFANANNYFTTDQATELLELVSSESKRLSLAESAYPKITDPANFSRLTDLFDNETNRNAFMAYVNSYNASHPVYNNNNGNGYNNNNGYNNQYRIPMTDANFNILVQNVKKQWLPGGKMATLTDAFANTNNYFTTYQAKQLIQLVSDEDNRLQLAKSAYVRLTDPSNFTQLYDLFSNQSRRNELAAYANSNNNNSTGSNNNNNQYRTAMTDASFNSLADEVKKQWLPGGKMSVLIDIFANTNNYFSSYQAKQLIQLVSDEDNRLQLAKSAYPHIVDLGNFTQLYDLFTSQARKDDLRNYINSYSYNR